jgi:hypothetical protein
MNWFKNVCTPTTVGNIEIACGFTEKGLLQDSGQCGGWRSKSYLPKVNPLCFGGRGKHQEITLDIHISFKLLFFHF